MGNSSSKLKKYLYGNDELAALELYQASSELRKGFDPNLTFGESYAHDTPLHVACRNSMRTLIQLFLSQRNGNPNKRNSRNETSLHCVCMSVPQDATKSNVQQRRFECLQLILNWRGAKMANGEFERASTSARDEKGNTVLHYAAASGLRRCVELLIEQQPSLLYAENGQKQSPCDCAQMNNHLELASFLESRMVFNETDEAEEQGAPAPTSQSGAPAPGTSSTTKQTSKTDTTGEARVLKNANAAQISSRFSSSSSSTAPSTAQPSTSSKTEERSEKARVLEDAPESYTGLSATDLQEVKDYVIVEVAEMLRVDLASAQALLLQHEWSRKQLLESWFSDPVKCCVKSGVSLPDWLASEATSRPELVRRSAPPAPIATDSTTQATPNFSRGSAAESLSATPTRRAGDTISIETEADGGEQDVGVLIPLICEICAGLIEVRDTERVAGRLSCKHEFCAACWERYLTNKVQEGNVQSITCPAFGCSMVIGADMLERLVSRDVARKYLQFDVKAFVEANPNLKWCPHPGCGRVVMRPQRPLDAKFAASFRTGRRLPPVDPVTAAQPATPTASVDVSSTCSWHAADSATASPTAQCGSAPSCSSAESHSIPIALAALPDFLEAHRNELGALSTSGNDSYARVFAGDSDVSHAVDCGRGHAFCWECLGEAHEPVGCERLKEWLAKCAQMNADSLRNIEGESEMAANYLWLVTNSKPCPSCRSPIQKNEGCNHMKCSKCKHDFCWVCLESWKKHSSATGGYFRCNRYEVAKAVESAATRQRDEAAARNASLQQLSRFMHYYTRFQNHDHSLRLELPLLETARAKAHSLARHSVAVPDAAAALEVGAELDFLERSVRELLRARRFLKHSYAYGFFIEGGYKKPVFESMQTDLEESTETLAEMLGRPYLKTPRWKIIDTARLVRRRRCEFTEALERGLIPAFDSEVYYLPRYASSSANAARRRASLGFSPAGRANVIDEDVFRQLLEHANRAGTADPNAPSIDPATAWVKDKTGRHRNLNALLDAHRDRLRRSTSNPPPPGGNAPLDNRPRSAAFSDATQGDPASGDEILFDFLLDDEEAELASDEHGAPNAASANSILEFDALASYINASMKQTSSSSQPGASTSQVSSSGPSTSTATSSQSNTEVDSFDDFLRRRTRRRYGGFLDSFSSSSQQSTGFSGLFGGSSNRCRRSGCRRTRRRLITRLSDYEGYCSSHCMQLDRIANRHRKSSGSTSSQATTPGLLPGSVRTEADVSVIDHGAPSSSTSPPGPTRASPSRASANEADFGPVEAPRSVRQLIPRDREVPSATATRLNDAQMRMNYNYTLELLRALELSRIEYLREHSDGSTSSAVRSPPFTEAAAGDERLVDDTEETDDPLNDYEQRLLQVALEMSLATPRHTDVNVSAGASASAGASTSASAGVDEANAGSLLLVEVAANTNSQVADVASASTPAQNGAQAQASSSSTTESSPC